MATAAIRLISDAQPRSRGSLESLLAAGRSVVREEEASVTGDDLLHVSALGVLSNIDL